MDKRFLRIRFVFDGVDIKMSSSGLNEGSSPSGSMLMAEHVKSEHTRRLGRDSPIVVRLLALQIYAHALAYTKCAKAVEASGGLNPVIASIIEGKCGKLQAHANPVNASWLELGALNTTGLGLDK